VSCAALTLRSSRAGCNQRSPPFSPVNNAEDLRTHIHSPLPKKYPGSEKNQDIEVTEKKAHIKKNKKPMGNHLHSFPFSYKTKKKDSFQ
jgi:hypothetical protein